MTSFTNWPWYRGSTPASSLRLADGFQRVTIAGLQTNFDPVDIDREDFESLLDLDIAANTENYLRVWRLDPFETLEIVPIIGNLGTLVDFLGTGRAGFSLHSITPIDSGGFLAQRLAEFHFWIPATSSAELGVNNVSAVYDAVLPTPPLSAFGEKWCHPNGLHLVNAGGQETGDSTVRVRYNSFGGNPPGAGLESPPSTVEVWCQEPMFFRLASGAVDQSINSQVLFRRNRVGAWRGRKSGAA